MTPKILPWCQHSHLIYGLVIRVTNANEMYLFVNDNLLAMCNYPQCSQVICLRKMKITVSSSDVTKSPAFRFLLYIYIYYASVIECCAI